ncbi:aldehyde reductase 1 [Ascobolus immersus RN42]|uniref:Aldehyde reductase 1 n=1 Tax=Ascobolus immersus RN42 TaxID=1160509 RepID=A0A3N4INL8_ASCIM|nr:aldehyde reductase 1 [Ascobolus immersus RN42]
MAPTTSPTLTSKDGSFSIPAIGFGTFDPAAWGPGGSDVMKGATLHALKSGYRHIDTASSYCCEGDVGWAIRESGIPREEIFVTTKLWNQMHAPEDVAVALNGSLKELGLEYVDLFLMHWPVAFKRTEDYKPLDSGVPEPVLGMGEIPVIDVELSNNHKSTWRAMEKLQREGKTKHIGVSNFTIPQLKKLLEYAEIKPVVNQVESHPYFPQKELLAFLKENDILLTAYSPLGSQSQICKPDAPQLRDDPKLAEISKKTGYTFAQLAISWAVKRGTSLVPKSTKPERIEDNLKVVELSEEDFEAIDTIVEKHPELKTCYTDWFDKTWNTHAVLGYGLFEYN